MNERVRQDSSIKRWHAEDFLTLCLPGQPSHRHLRNFFLMSHQRVTPKRSLPDSASPRLVSPFMSWLCDQCLRIPCMQCLTPRAGRAQEQGPWASATSASAATVLSREPWLDTLLPNETWMNKRGASNDQFKNAEVTKDHSDYVSRGLSGTGLVLSSYFEEAIHLLFGYETMGFFIT